MVRYIGKLCILRGTLLSKHLAPSEYWSMEKILELKSKYCCFREHDQNIFLSKGLAIHCVGGLSAGLWLSKRFRRYTYKRKKKKKRRDLEGKRTEKKKKKYENLSSN
jgi:hypothetical protein